jgi:hypothetical protein
MQFSLLGAVAWRVVLQRCGLSWQEVKSTLLAHSGRNLAGTPGRLYDPQLVVSSSSLAV